MCARRVLILSEAPNTSAFSPGEYDGPLRHHDAGPPEEVQMTGLQIALAREIGGWPLYTIIIAAGQVSSDDAFAWIRCLMLSFRC